MTTTLNKKKLTSKSFSDSRSNSQESSNGEDEIENENKEEGKNSQFTKKKRQRQENSLGELTKSFISYVSNCKKDKININDVVRELHVKKRRIYDITNVLEGIGYIKKLAKNEISWIKKEAIVQFDQKNKELKDDKAQELNNLIRENEKLDSYLQVVQKEIQTLSEQPDWKTYGYITFEDLSCLSKEENLKLIAIKAPPDTIIDIPDKTETNKIKITIENEANLNNEAIDNNIIESISKEHQIYLESQNGEISVYLVLNNNNNNEIVSDYNNYKKNGSILQDNKNDFN